MRWLLRFVCLYQINFVMHMLLRFFFIFSCLKWLTTSTCKQDSCIRFAFLTQDELFHSSPLRLRSGLVLQNGVLTIIFWRNHFDAKTSTLSNIYNNMCLEIIATFLIHLQSIIILKAGNLRKVNLTWNLVNSQFTKSFSPPPPTSSFIRKV